MRITEALSRAADQSRRMGLGVPSIIFNDRWSRDEFLRCIEVDLGHLIRFSHFDDAPMFDGIQFKVQSPTVPALNYMDEPYLSAG